MQNREESRSSEQGAAGDSPWQRACCLPSHHGLAVDVQAHMCVPGGYVLSTPEFFLLARPVPWPDWWMAVLSSPFPDFEAWKRRIPKIKEGDRWMDDFRLALLDPFHRWPREECNAWCIGVLTGDMVKAWDALEIVGGPMPYVCWQDRRNGYRWRKTGPAFNAFLDSVAQRSKRVGNVKRIIRERCCHQTPEGVAGAIVGHEQGNA